MGVVGVRQDKIFVNTYAIVLKLGGVVYYQKLGSLNIGYLKSNFNFMTRPPMCVFETGFSKLTNKINMLECHTP